jgi:chromosome partitioning protein
MPDIISFSNQKGGVGKTSSAFALAEVLNGAYDQEVVMVDMDPQASLTYAAEIKPNKTMADFIMGKADPEIHKLQDGLYLIPSGIELADAGLDLANRTGRTRKLKGILEMISGADTIIIDCPPSLSLLTVNALVASDFCIIPTRATTLDIVGIDLLTDTIQAVRENTNPDLEIMGVLITFYDPRLIHSREVLEQLQEKNLRLFDTMIGQSTRVAEARGESVVRYAPRNKRAKEYIEFTREVYQWLK